MRALKWSFASSFATRLGSVLSGIVLARLLSPADFGAYTVGAVGLYVTASINDMGIEPVLVRWPGDLRKVCPTAVTLVMTASTALFIVFWVGAPVFAAMFGSPASTNIVRLMSFALLISGAGTTSAAVLTRSFAQKARTSADLAGLVVSITLSLGLAWSGAGAYSLAWGHLAGNFVAAAILVARAPQRYGPGFDLGAARVLLRSGITIASAGLVTVGILNIDYLLVGHLLGSAQLGLYVLAWNISSFPVALLSGAIVHVSVAGFARLREDQGALDRAFVRAFGAVMTAALPVAALLACLSLPAVLLLYGEPWSGAATPLRFLAVMGALRVGALLVSDVLVAMGRGRLLFTLQALWLATLAPAIALGARLSGLRGVGLAQLLVAAVVVFPAYLFALRRLRFRLRPLAWATFRPAIGGLCSVVVCVAVTHADLSNLATVVYGTTFGLLIYLLPNPSLWLPIALLVKQNLGRTRHSG